MLIILLLRFAFDYNPGQERMQVQDVPESGGRRSEGKDNVTVYRRDALGTDSMGSAVKPTVNNGSTPRL